MKRTLSNYLKTVDLFDYPPEIIALAYRLVADDPAAVIGIPVEDAGLSEEDFYRLVCAIDEARLTADYELI